ncbi:MAG: carbon-nitrogen hydrolase family protein [Marmoricola sp.]|nr:carbon-nitrogen hydrolase family protein [Marmoricola sp.]
MSGNPDGRMRRVKVAVVQTAPGLEAVEENLLVLEDLVRDAVRVHNPQIVVLPEAAVSPAIARPGSTTSGVRPVDGAPMHLYRQLARELDVVVGGGFLARRGPHVYSTYVVAEPDGRVQLHNKSALGLWDGTTNIAGRSQGRKVLDAFGSTNVGVACGWEWARTHTARKLSRRVDLAIGGMSWPTLGTDRTGAFGSWVRRENERQEHMAVTLPRLMARLIGAPVAVAVTVAPDALKTTRRSSLPENARLVGQSQIVDASGTVLASIDPGCGAGHVAAEVAFARPEPRDVIPTGDWITTPSIGARAAMPAIRIRDRVLYEGKRTLSRHDWQDWPAADFEAEIGAGDANEQAVATGAPGLFHPSW